MLKRKAGQEGECRLAHPSGLVHLRFSGMRLFSLKNV
jgi:hypothetical protein